MAIIEALPGLKVTIESQDSILPEHEDAESEWTGGKYDTPVDKRQFVYAECISDTTFRIAVSTNPPFKPHSTGLAFWVSIDGQGIGGCKIMPPFVGDHHSTSIQEANAPLGSGRTSYSELKFTSLRKGTSKTIQQLTNDVLMKVVDDIDATHVKTDKKLRLDWAKL
jgi:hypothetical protein